VHYSVSRFSLIFDTELPADATLFGASLAVIPAAFRRSRYNICRDQQIIVLHADDVQVAASTMQWGFIPHWVHCADPALQPLTITDRKLDQPYFREAFQQRRCLIPASGFYAWQCWENGPAAPYYVQMQDRQPFLMAGIWDRWAGVDRVALITTATNTLLQPIHDRMPAILSPDQIGEWLCGAQPRSLLAPYPSAAMTTYRVAHRLFCPDHDAIDLIEPVEQHSAA
jgi:putative SOS response-associated peptidase YedK